MKTSTKGKIALAVSEGIVVTPYLDSVGVWTVGIGVTAGAGDIDPSKHKGKVFTIPELMKMYEKVLVKYEKTVSDSVRVPVSQQEFDAMVHFCYNIGQAGFKRSNLLKNLNSGNRQAAFASGFHGWLKPASLKGRRDKERDMALKGLYGGSTAPVYGVNSKFKPVRQGSYTLSARDFNPTAPTKPVDKPKVPVGSPSTPGGQTSSTTLLDVLKSIFTKLFGG